jgi:molybdopterin molybdotransferase
MRKPPPLKNDCFALPQGANWTPVDEALGYLKLASKCLVGTEKLSAVSAAGRVLAEKVHALYSSPPHKNSAVDGYALNSKDLKESDLISLTILPGIAAAGHPYYGEVMLGEALPIYTGAKMPAGTDTVILQEDTVSENNKLTFYGPLKSGANTRDLGEDVEKNSSILLKGRRITAGDIALMASTGVSLITVYSKLKVGIFSTGDEIVSSGSEFAIGQVFDANRPLLNALLDIWGFDVIDLGILRDDRKHIETTLEKASTEVDVIITSGGASAGQEDHMSAILTKNDSLSVWRIAVKPGRPLVLAVYNGTPVFGLPGNPVAAGTCAMVFAKPALNVFSGREWLEPLSFNLPANFSKLKKAGRREFLRARIRNSKVDVFQSEGSGRVSGLSWAEGFVDLPEQELSVLPGDFVKYIPFSSYMD